MDLFEKLKKSALLEKLKRVFGPGAPPDNIKFVAGVRIPQEGRTERTTKEKCNENDREKRKKNRGK
mgnify:CR=1 FL=1